MNSHKKIFLDNDTKCIYEILKKENEITSKRILELAATDEFKEICVGCVSGDAFLRAAMKLENQGIIKKSLGKGGFHWKLLITD